MSNERQDEFFSWRSRLGPPDALPEEGLDNRDLAWERLAHRLGKAPMQRSGTRRRLIGYRVAAACLLPALILTVRFFHDRPTRPAHQSATPAPVAFHPPAPTVSSPAQLTPVTLRPIEGSRILRSGPTPVPHSASTPILHSRPPQILPSPVWKLAALTPDSPVLISRPDPSPETALSPLSQQKTLKTKQLRVVHLNELDNFSRPQQATTSNHYRDPDIKALILLKHH
jgi:hypothetical protein